MAGIVAGVDLRGEAALAGEAVQVAQQAEAGDVRGGVGAGGAGGLCGLGVEAGHDVDGDGHEVVDVLAALVRG